MTYKLKVWDSINDVKFIMTVDAKNLVEAMSKAFEKGLHVTGW